MVGIVRSSYAVSSVLTTQIVFPSRLCRELHNVVLQSVLNLLSDENCMCVCGCLMVVVKIEKKTSAYIIQSLKEE